MNERGPFVHTSPEHLGRTLAQEREDHRIQVTSHDRKLGRGASERSVVVSLEKNSETGRPEILLVDPGPVSMLRGVEQAVDQAKERWGVEKGGGF